ncbi:hypothetical protein [Adhaeribacter soli]|uniref:Uncharacterized protein n=1 Tax=Adhaeribacter soli TaxID=2607655 RepID=A0A5N1IWB4_9BACT|nr:hypothetical protein [Adhaeribacter soli]KAA9338805.1 hypothetical protein F0P94_08390 [Adhaeribacter soli]
MKKLKDLTLPVAGRVSPDLKQKFEKAADELGLSLAQYVSMMLYLAEYSEAGLYKIKSQLLGPVKKEDPQCNIREKKDKAVWEKAPFSDMLSAVLKNEEILAEIYVTNGNKPILSNELVKNGFKYNVLLQGEYLESTYYYYTGLHGWAFTDSSKKYVVITKKV